MPDSVTTHDQIIADAVVKADKLTADLERDAKSMAAAPQAAQQVTASALKSSPAAGGVVGNIKTPRLSPYE